jgi:hypothetical protein
MIRRWKAGLAALVLGVLAAGVASAASYRQPETGRPAIDIVAPDNWTVDRPQGMSLNLTNAKRNGALSITIETVDAGFSLTRFRDNAFKAASCTTLDRVETTRVAGRTAPTYYCQPPQTFLAPTRVALVQLDPTHVLSVGQLHRLDATAADIEALEQAIATIRIEP